MMGKHFFLNWKRLQRETDGRLTLLSSAPQNLLPTGHLLLRVVNLEVELLFHFLKLKRLPSQIKIQSSLRVFVASQKYFYLFF